jgi:hypothetical protein
MVICCAAYLYSSGYNIWLESKRRTEKVRDSNRILSFVSHHFTLDAKEIQIQPKITTGHLLWKAQDLEITQRKQNNSG